MPELRFPEFTDEWCEYTLSEICTGFDYGMGAAAKTFDGENKYIRITDIDDQTHKYIDVSPVSPNGILEEKYIVRNNDILFARTGASVGKTYKYNSNDGKLYFAGFLIRANVNPSFNVDFIFANTLTAKYDRWVKSTSMRSGQPGINSQEYGTFKLKAPTLQEQNKIAHLIALIDKRIALQLKLIDALKLYKRGVENLYFSKKYNNHCRVEDILVERNEKSTKNNEYDVISSTKNGLFKQCDYFNKQASSEDTTGYKIIKREQIVFSPQNLWMGNINYNGSYNIGIVSPSYKIFDINEDFDKYYIACLMKSPKAIKEYALASEQGASIVRRNLNMELFLRIAFSMPDLEEQIKISKHLKLLSNHLDNQENALKALLAMKQGLLQKMFI